MEKLETRRKEKVGAFKTRLELNQASNAIKDLLR